MSLKILVVDDSATMRKMITRALCVSGLPVAQVYEASNGHEGLLALAKYQVDLALIDVTMPEMNGEEMIARVRKNPGLGALPIVVVSTLGSAHRIAEMLRHPAVGFVHKPFTPERLSQVVQEVMGGDHGKETEQSSVPFGGPDF